MPAVHYARAAAGSLVAAAILCAPVQATAQRGPVQNQLVPLSPDELHQGWLASGLIGKDVFSRAGIELGQVRNVMVSKNSAEIESLVIESGVTRGEKEYVFRVPWQKVESASLPKRVVVDITDSRAREYDFFNNESVQGATQPATDFPVSELIGDRARLKTGLGYGYVRDVLFTAPGRLRAVLITRGLRLGGGTVAFAFPLSPSERWKANASYYGLPYVTTNQANTAALAVDLDRLRGHYNGSKG